MSVHSVPFPQYYSAQWNYSLEAHHTPKKTTLIMHAPHSLLSTSLMPRTAEILLAIEPRILRTKCFNSKNIPFSEEVKNTEIAHLFEHILLEYLCQERINSGRKTAQFSGLTLWNWKKDSRGIFHVEITGNKMDEDLFVRAFSRSIILIETIFARHTTINSKQIDLDYLFVKKMHE